MQFMNELSSQQEFMQLTNAIKANVSAAIIEDLSATGAKANDVTATLIAPNQLAKASIISRESAVICGVPWVEECFKQIAPSVSIDWQVKEGEAVSPNQTLCTLTGKAQEMLSAERCALNFLQTLSATATLTKQYVDAVAGTKARIMDTRKTLPG